MNLVLIRLIPRFYGSTYEVKLGMAKPVVTQVSAIQAIWAVEGALLLGIVTVLVFAFKPVSQKFAEGTKAAVAGSLLASMNTASEYGFPTLVRSCARIRSLLTVAGPVYSTSIDRIIGGPCCCCGCCA